LANYDINKFKDWIKKTIANIESAIKETDEMQTAFNSEYVNKFKLAYDSILSGAAENAVKLYFNGELKEFKTFHESLGSKINEKKLELAKRKKDLETQLNKTEDEIKSVKDLNSDLLNKLKKINPKLNEREEAQKVIVSRHEGSAITLKKNIETLSKGLGFIINFFTLSKFKTNLKKEIEILKNEKNKLKKIRDEYFKVKSDADKDIGDLEKEYRENVACAASIRQNLNLLQNAFETTCVLESVTALFEEASQETVSPLISKIPQITEILKLRAVKKDYEKSLKTVSEEIGFLNGIKSGFLNLDKTADSLLTQYNQYSSYLKPINFNISDKCEKFSENFKTFADKIVDDRGLSKTPADFLKITEPFQAELLNESTVKSVFDEIARSIKTATAAWK